MQKGPEKLNQTNQEQLKKFVTFAVVKASIAVPLQPLAQIMVYQQHTGADLLTTIKTLLKGGLKKLFSATTSSVISEGSKGLSKGVVMVKGQEYAQEFFPDPSHLHCIARGAFAGTVMGVINPSFITDRYRIFKMTRDKVSNVNFIQYLKQIYQNQSNSYSKPKKIMSLFPELFRGFGINFFKHMSTSLNFFIFKEFMDKISTKKNDTSSTRVLNIVVPAGAATLGALPFDVVQTRLQAQVGQKISALTLFNNIRQTSGIKGFTAGLFPKSMLTLVSYSLNAGFLNYFNHRSSAPSSNHFEEAPVQKNTESKKLSMK